MDTLITCVIKIRSVVEWSCDRGNRNLYRDSYDSAGTYAMEVIADRANQAEETDEGNNTLTQAIVVGLSYILNINKGGTGTGTETSSPAAIACGADCS